MTRLGKYVMSQLNNCLGAVADSARGLATYGARRVWHDILALGQRCGLHRIERLMREQALRARPRRRGLAGLARSTYYYQRQPNMSAEQQSDMQGRIRAVYDRHKGRYGYSRITAALCSSMAEPVNHKCVQRLMQKMRLRALIRAKKRSRNVPGVSDVHVPNVLQRDFCATAPNQKWATDITEFNVRGHKLYLSACMDLYNGEIIAHRMARRPVFDLVSGTLGAALSRAGHTNELTVYSDQGWHYKMQPYRTMLARCGVTQSMSRKGNCFDNAVIEGIEALEAGVNDY